MSKIDEVRSAMFAAMKAKDKERKDALSALLTALKNKAIDKRADLTEEEENQVVLKEIKQLKETLELTPEDRTDIRTECTNRITVLEEFAPHMMDTDEIKAVVSEVLLGLGIAQPTGKDKGKIMKELMPRVKGKADGKLVNEVVASFLKYPRRRCAKGEGPVNTSGLRLFSFIEALHFLQIIPEVYKKCPGSSRTVPYRPHGTPHISPPLSPHPARSSYSPRKSSPSKAVSPYRSPWKD